MSHQITRNTAPFKMTRILVKGTVGFQGLREMVERHGSINIESMCSHHALQIHSGDEIPTETVPCPCGIPECLLIEVVP